VGYKSMLTIYIIVYSGIFVDMASCLLFLRRNHKASGPSGLPLVTLILCYWLPLIAIDKPLFFSLVWIDCLCLFGIHIFLVFLIPILDRKIFYNKPSLK
jgi:hypothetical protein